MGEPQQTRRQTAQEQFDEWCRERRESATDDELRSYVDSDASASYRYPDEPPITQTKKAGRQPRSTGSRIPSNWEDQTESQNQRASNSSSSNPSINRRNQFIYESDIPQPGRRHISLNLMILAH